MKIIKLITTFLAVNIVSGCTSVSLNEEYHDKNESIKEVSFIEGFVSSELVDEAPKIKERMSPPRYPREAARYGLDGIVMFVIFINELGDIVNIQTEFSSDSLFEKAAMESVESMSFFPAKNNNVAVKTYVKQTIKFTLGR